MKEVTLDLERKPEAQWRREFSRNNSLGAGSSQRICWIDEEFLRELAEKITVNFLNDRSIEFQKVLRVVPTHINLFYTN